MRNADTLFTNVTIIDGGGGAPYRGEVAVAGGRFVAVGAAGGITADTIIDGHGKTIAPGFIDTHTHSDRAILTSPNGAAHNQGVTTQVLGNCGLGLAPDPGAVVPRPLDLLGQGSFFPSVEAYLGALKADPPSTNAVVLAGHTTMRLCVMGESHNRVASAEEIAAMCSMLRAGLEAGAAGLSLGTFYAPARHARMDELIALAQVVAEYDAVLTMHTRYDDGSDADLDEAFHILREAQVRGVISHLKFPGKPNHGRAAAVLSRIDAERKNGSRVWVDVYPYTAGSTMLHMDSVNESTRVVVTKTESHGTLAPADLSALADAWRVEPATAAQRVRDGCDLDALAAVWQVGREEAVRRLEPADGVFFMMDESDVEAVVSYPFAMFGSDGLPHSTHPHPRLFGSMARVHGQYVRDRGLLSSEEAVRKMTSLPAEVFGLRDRGMLAVGHYADAVLFDPATICDRATYRDPTQLSVGVDLVMVNGEIVWQDRELTAARSGQLIQRAAGREPASCTSSLASPAPDAARKPGAASGSRPFRSWATGRRGSRGR